MPDQHERDTEIQQRKAELFAARTASRLRLVERLENEGRDDLAARLEKCGRELRLKCTTCGTTKTVRVRCDNKWCPNCAPLLAWRAVERFTPAAREMRNPLFVTWTVKNWRDRVGLRELRRAFSKLYRLRWFKKRVSGGVCAFEVSRITEKERKRQRLGTRDGMGWHPHAHSLIDCNWLSVTRSRPAAGCSRDAWARAVRIALAEVAEQWSLGLGRKGSVKVRATFKTDNGDPTRGLRETLKYSVSPDVLETTDGEIAPLIDDLMMTRNLTTWGTFHCHPSLRKVKRDPTPCECGDCKTMMPAAMVDAWERKLGKDRRKK